MKFVLKLEEDEAGALVLLTQLGYKASGMEGYFNKLNAERRRQAELKAKSKKRNKKKEEGPKNDDNSKTS